MGMHSSIRRMQLLGMALLMLGMVFTALGSATPARAASCSGTGCNGQDPIATGCNSDAYTVTSANIKNLQNQVVGRVDLRWSPTCQTNWARAVSNVGSTNMFVVLLDCNYNEISGTYYQLAGTTSVYGDMKYNTTVRARGAFGANHASDVFGDTGCY